MTGFAYLNLARQNAIETSTLWMCRCPCANQRWAHEEPIIHNFVSEPYTYIILLVFHFRRAKRPIKTNYEHATRTDAKYRDPFVVRAAYVLTFVAEQ